MKIYNYPKKEAVQKLEEISKRSIEFSQKEYSQVSEIIDNIKKNGDKALLFYCKKFDAPNLKNIVVSKDEFLKAEKEVSKTFIKSIEKALSNIEDFHKKNLSKSWQTKKKDGTILGQIVQPVEKAGIYVPGSKGGKTPLVSSVLMGVIPAKVAGVQNIAVASPPQENGKINPHILFAAKLLNIEKIYKMGSAWAIAAFAYGTNLVEKVDVIAGPGNIFVTIAKKQVSHIVKIDSLAGPSEILIIADETANPKFIAADLLSQAEHDPLASAILLTTSKKVAMESLKEVKKQTKEAERFEIIEQSLKNYGAIFILKNIDEAIKLSNEIAPEHLELQIQNPFDKLDKIKNAGAVFLGNYSPEAVGDYFAGPNHILPTNKTAKFSSALLPETFMKKTSIISYSKEALKRDAKHIIEIAEIEKLYAHSNSIKKRL